MRGLAAALLITLAGAPQDPQPSGGKFIET
jgi:hypothetical protein